MQGCHSACIDPCEIPRQPAIGPVFTPKQLSSRLSNKSQCGGILAKLIIIQFRRKKKKKKATTENKIGQGHCPPPIYCVLLTHHLLEQVVISCETYHVTRASVPLCLWLSLHRCVHARLCVFQDNMPISVTGSKHRGA